VVWSIVGASGITREEERRQVLELERKTPNIVGLFMDDLFTGRTSGKLASLMLDQVRDVQKQLKQPGKKLDLVRHAVHAPARSVDPGVSRPDRRCDAVDVGDGGTGES
jgi:hypothetical protein